MPLCKAFTLPRRVLGVTACEQIRRGSTWPAYLDCIIHSNLAVRDSVRKDRIGGCFEHLRDTASWTLRMASANSVLDEDEHPCSDGAFCRGVAGIPLRGALGRRFLYWGSPLWGHTTV